MTKYEIDLSKHREELKELYNYFTEDEIKELAYEMYQFWDRCHELEIMK